MDWQLLAVREGRPGPDGPYEGVPQHLREPLIHWLGGVYGYHGRHLSTTGTTIMLRVAAACRIPLMHDSRGHRLYHEIVSYCGNDPEQFLDVIHKTLQLAKTPVEALDQTLFYGGSVWKARSTGLQRRVDATAQDAFDVASLPEDVVSEALREAWSKAYGREPDASDAWDHAIKAAEAILIPTVVPTQAGAHMGHVLGALDHQGAQWELMLGFNQTKPLVNPPMTPVQALVGMLRLLYPTPIVTSGRNTECPLLKRPVRWCTLPSPSFSGLAKATS